MKRILITLMLLLAFFAVNAQQECGAVDCLGRCGRFVDDNGDGFCDRGGLSAPAVEEPKTTKAETAAAKAEHPTTKENKSEQTNAQSADDITTENDNSKQVTIESETKTAVPASTTSTVEKATTPADPYPVYHILTGLLVLYGISILLVKKNVWQKATHRKVWNIALTVTFLISCLLGVLLAIFIHHNYYPQSYVEFLHIHVWFGIGMTIIALFHALWHINYFKAIFKKK